MIIQSVLTDWATGFLGKALNLGGQLAFPQEGALSALKEQLLNAQRPVALPPPEALLSAYLQGWFEWDSKGKPVPEGMDQFLWGMRGAGAALGNAGFAEDFAKVMPRYKGAWQKVVESKASRPGIKEAFQAYIANVINKADFEMMLRRSGAYIKDWEWLIPFYSNRLSLDQVFDVFHRGLMSEKEFDSYARMLQFGVPGDIEKLKQISMIIPGPQDIIRLAVRDTFNPELVKELQLDKELDENTTYLTWANAVGLGETSIKDATGKVITADFAKQAWYAHWELPSPGMGYGFLHRFYGKSKYGPSPWLQFAEEFNKDHLSKLLKANDFSPRYRDHLSAMSYNPLTRVDIRRLRTRDIIKQADVYHNFRASGYADTEAQQMTDWVEKEAKAAQNKEEKDGIKKRTCKAYQTGVIDGPRMIQVLQQVGFEQKEVDLQKKLCDIDMSLSIATDGVSSVKAGYMSGAFDKKEARLQLEKLGIQNDRIIQYQFSWELRMNSRRKVVAAKEVSGWFVDDIIDMEDLISRLTKLQYNAQDVTRIVQAAQLDKAKRIQKAQKAAYQELQKQIEKNLREAEKQRKEAEKLRREREQALKRAADEAAKADKHRLEQFLSARTEANLRKWLAGGEITEAEIRDTFRLKGWIDSDITRWLTVEREKRN